MDRSASWGAEERGQASFSTSRHGGGGSEFRDRDPPPSYSGEDPETTFQNFERSVKLWEWETDVPKVKRGAKLLRAMTGLAKLAVEDMPFDEIACEEGVSNVLRRLKEFFLPQLEVSLPRAFENAVYGQHRSSKEGFAEYIGRMERAFARLAREGVELPDGAQGYILFRHSGLNEHQEQRLLTWCDGRYDKVSIVKALRKLDKVLKDKDRSKGTYVTEELDGTIQDDENVTDDDQYVYLADGDLDDIYEEKDLQTALASYREAREALKDQRLGRGFFPQAEGAHRAAQASYEVLEVQCHWPLGPRMHAP